MWISLSTPQGVLFEEYLSILENILARVRYPFRFPTGIRLSNGVVFRVLVQTTKGAHRPFLGYRYLGCPLVDVGSTPQPCRSIPWMSVINNDMVEVYYQHQQEDIQGIGSQETVDVSLRLDQHPKYNTIRQAYSRWMPSCSYIKNKDVVDCIQKTTEL